MTEVLIGKSWSDLTADMMIKERKSLFAHKALIWQTFFHLVLDYYSKEYTSILKQNAHRNRSYVKSRNNVKKS